MFDYNVYAMCGDGCMMEGVGSEAASLAGHLRLGNLCWIYDSNHITIEGHTELAFSEDVAARFLGYGWNVLRVGDANDRERIADAIADAKRTNDRPTLIIVESHIGYGAPHQAGHVGRARRAAGRRRGEARPSAATAGPRTRSSWCPTASASISPPISARAAKSCAPNGMALFDALPRPSIPISPKRCERMQRRELPDGWDQDIPVFPADPKGIASRDSSGKVLNAIAPRLPWLLGGAADLAPSTKTRLTFDGAGDFEADNYGGRNFHFGIREHAMGAICNGLALSKLRPYGSSFLIFSDYMKPPIRLSALMELPVIYVFTHDSIGLGEDGPTHQPIEQLVALRAIPGLIVLRPADANEVAEAWRVALAAKHQPACLVLSRQNPADLRPHAIRAGERRRRAAPMCWPMPAAAPPR